MADNGGNNYLGEEGAEALRLLKELQDQADLMNEQLEELLQAVQAPPEAVELALEVAPADPAVNRTNFVAWIRGEMPSLQTASNAVMEALSMAFGFAAVFAAMPTPEAPAEEMTTIDINPGLLLARPKEATSVVDAVFTKEAKARRANAHSMR